MKQLVINRKTGYVHYDGAKHWKAGKVFEKHSGNRDVSWYEYRPLENGLGFRRHRYRPKDGTGNAGHLEAVKYHLEDMRQLAGVKK